MQARALKSSWTLDGSEVKAKVKPAQEIKIGGLYEVWFDESAGAQPALAIGPAPFRCFKVLVNGKSETIAQESIFETGAAPPPDILPGMFSKYSHQMQEEEDQKFLKMLSEIMLNK
jgi:hypothetical protein